MSHIPNCWKSHVAAQMLVKQELIRSSSAVNHIKMGLTLALLADDPALTIKRHRNCVSTYTRQNHFSRHLKRKGDRYNNIYIFDAIL